MKDLADIRHHNDPGRNLGSHHRIVVWSVSPCAIPEGRCGHCGRRTPCQLRILLPGPNVGPGACVACLRHCFRGHVVPVP